MSLRGSLASLRSLRPAARLLLVAERLLLRLPTPEPGPLRLGHRRIYVLPTGAGWALALTLLVMLIASINYELSLGYALTFLLGGIATASLMHAFRNLLGLEVRPGRADPVFAGEFARPHLLLKNPSNLRRPALTLRARLHGALDRDPQEALLPCGLAAEDERELELVLPTVRRGPMALGRCSLSTLYPLGFIRAWSVFTPNLQWLVYPTPEPKPPPLPGSGALQAGQRSGGRGEDDFAGLRPFQPSDSPRHVAWKTLARGGPMMTKTFSGASGSEFRFDWHELPPDLEIEARLSRLCAWICLAEAHGLRYTLVLPQQTLGPASGSAHSRACLSALALFAA